MASLDSISSPRLSFLSPILTYKCCQWNSKLMSALFSWLLASDGMFGAVGMSMAQNPILVFATTWDIHVAILESASDETDRIDLVFVTKNISMRISPSDLLWMEFHVIPAPFSVPKYDSRTDTSLGYIVPYSERIPIAINASSWSSTFSVWKGSVKRRK
jgi:hypothetical protein